MKKKTLLAPLVAAAMALWMGIADAKTELFFTSPTISKPDGTALRQGSLKEMEVETRRAGVPVSWATYPSGIAIDRQGSFFYGEVSHDPLRVSLKKLGPRGFVTDLGMLVDASAGSVSSGGWGFDLALSPHNELYFNHPSIRDGQGNIVSRGYIAKLDLKTKVKTTVVSGLDDPSGLALDQLGNLYYGNVSFNPFKVQVYKRTPAGQVMALGTAVDASAGSVSLGGWGFDLVAGQKNALFFNHPSVRDAQGQVLVSGHIGKINLDTGAKSVLVTGLDEPSGLAVDDAGSLYFGNLNQAAKRWGVSKRAPNGTVTRLGTVVDGWGGQLRYGGWGLDLALNACKDTDGDALCDDWEEFGYDADGDGVIDVDLPAMGASKLRKDVFVEVDWMHGHEPRPHAMEKVVAAFRDAPVSNPDGSRGISLHLDTGHLGGGNRVRFQENLVPLWREMDRIKAHNFDPKRARIFHYALLAHAVNNTSQSGESRGIPASDFVVSMGWWPEGSENLKRQASTFMHELGHNLGLRHGGTDDDHYKPNFMSVMNYLYQMDWLLYDGKRSLLDYSSIDIAPLDEKNLNENVGLVQLGGSRPLSKYGIEWFDNRGFHHAALSATGPIDWNADGTIAPGSVKVDINRSGTRSLVGARINEWESLVFDGGDVGFGNKVRAQTDAQAMELRSTGREELTFEMYRRLTEGRHPQR